MSQDKPGKPRLMWVNPVSLVIPENRIWSELTPDQEAMLREDIKKHGVKEPLIGQFIEGQKVITNGGHRAVIAAQLGIKKVPIWMTEGSEGKTSLQNVVLSVLQGKTRTTEVVKQFQHMIGEMDISPAEIEQNSPFSEGYTRTLLRIAEGSPFLLDYLDEGSLTISEAAELARIGDPNDQYRAAQMCVRAGYKIKDIKDVVAQIITEESKPPEERKPIEKVQSRGIPCQLCGSYQRPGALTTLMLCPVCMGIITEGKQSMTRTTKPSEDGSISTTLPKNRAWWIGDQYEEGS